MTASSDADRGAARWKNSIAQFLRGPNRKLGSVTKPISMPTIETISVPKSSANRVCFEKPSIQSKGYRCRVSVAWAKPCRVSNSIGPTLCKGVYADLHVLRKVMHSYGQFVTKAVKVLRPATTCGPRAEKSGLVNQVSAANGSTLQAHFRTDCLRLARAPPNLRHEKTKEINYTREGIRYEWNSRILGSSGPLRHA